MRSHPLFPSFMTAALLFSDDGITRSLVRSIEFLSCFARENNGGVHNYYCSDRDVTTDGSPVSCIDDEDGCGRG